MHGRVPATVPIFLLLHPVLRVVDPSEIAVTTKATKRTKIASPGRSSRKGSVFVVFVVTAIWFLDFLRSARVQNPGSGSQDTAFSYN
jgi:hypothetical protein